MTTTPPTLVAHADWSTDPAERWAADARLQPDERYLVSAPRLVGATGTYLSRLEQQASGGATLAGFDFPIGVPRAYASRAGVKDFLSLLRELGGGRWSRFYDIATAPDEVSSLRPFYPFRPGGTSRDHLVRGIGVASFQELLRRCERRHDGRSDACSLFWTLGGNQVGRAAIAGWREVLAAATRRDDVGFWPFQGRLEELLRTRKVVIAETYPAEAYGHVGARFAPGESKQRQTDRRRRGLQALDWATRAGIRLDPCAEQLLRDGFGPAKRGEDAFDAVLGLLGMLAVVLGHRSSGEPAEDASVRSLEGWILGQAG